MDANGNPFTVTYIQAKGDPITDLYEDMAAEQKARSTYEWLINLSDDPCVIDPYDSYEKGKSSTSSVLVKS